MHGTQATSDGGAADGFRAQVWNAAGVLVLDTARELGDHAVPPALGNGSVVVHQRGV